MKKFIALLTTEKLLRKNWKMMALTFFELYTVYIKNQKKNFSILICMCTIILIKLHNFRKRKIYIAHHRTPNLIYAFILSHMHRKCPERACITITSSRLTSMLYILSSKNPTSSNFLKSCHSICFVLVGVIKHIYLRY